MTYESCPCGAGGALERRALKAFCVAMMTEPFGTEEITHREYECPSCGRQVKWHDRERRLMGWKRLSTGRCTCSDLLAGNLTERD